MGMCKEEKEVGVRQMIVHVKNDSLMVMIVVYQII